MVKKKLVTLILLGFILFSCSKKEKTDNKILTTTLFTEIESTHSHIDFMNTVKQTDSFNIVRYTYALQGGGVAVGDINNDGLQDIYFTANNDSNKLYLNKGNFKFQDITQKAGVTDSEGWSTGVCMIDINNDGWQDIYVCKSASVNNPELRKNKLFINQKDGTFKNDAALWGLDHEGFSIQAYFLDYDKDGDLDMYLVNHRTDFENTLSIEDKKNRKYYPETSDHLFRNNGNNFTDVTKEAGLINKEWGLSASIGDFNNDTWPDIYVANDYIAPDYLYINNKNGTFTNQIDTRLKHISYNSMGSDFSDINNDFLPDLLVLEMSSEDHIRSKENMPTMNTEGFNMIVKSDYHYPYMSNVLQLNNGNGSFSDVGQLAGISKTDWSWAPLIADFDNDGLKDIFVTNGIERNIANQDYIRVVKKNLDENVHMTIHEVIDMMPQEKIANYIFKNEGDLKFNKKNEFWGFEKKVNSNGAAYADFDNDGDLDLVINNSSDKASLYENHATKNFISLKLKGSDKNVQGVGAIAKVFLGGHDDQYLELNPVRGYLSSVTNVLNFGIDNYSTIPRIEVIWPDGKVSILEDIQANQMIEVDYKNAGQESTTRKNVVRNIVKINPTRLGIDYKHQENNFDDFSKQVLLPQKLSQQGPALAIADVNGDGLEDLFLGGAAGQSASLYIQNSQKMFQRSDNEIFVNDMKFEDTDAIFFDADNDGDMDLYVVSGGYEFPENSNMLQDRLYLNNGKGQFNTYSKLPSMLINSKKVGVFDFNKDGYPDLFIAGQVLPGKYPQSCRSYVLKNIKGSFQDVTNEVAPDFFNLGIVNDFIFSDHDGDGDKDIILVGEWMPITILDNSNGVFSKKEIKSFLKTEGWWNTLKEIDVDNDGDMDYVFGNLGENNKFHPTIDKPLHIYGNNFDDNDTYDMVLSKIYKGQQVPVRGKECSTAQNPFVSEVAPTYKEFAVSSLVDIYGEDQIRSSYHKESYTFSTLSAINNGDGTFLVQPLPVEAQMGPTLGLDVYDINNDGFNDLIGIGGIHEAEVETIRYDGNTGYIVLGSKDGFLPYKDYNFYNDKNAKKIQDIQIGGRSYFLIANNDSSLTIFSEK